MFQGECSTRNRMPTHSYMFEVSRQPIRETTPACSFALRLGMSGLIQFNQRRFDLCNFITMQIQPSVFSKHWQFNQLSFHQKKFQPNNHFHKYYYKKSWILSEALANKMVKFMEKFASFI